MTDQLPLYERIAKVAHAANAAWREVNGEPPLPAWEEAPLAHRASYVAGVKQALGGATPEQLHNSWMAAKQAAGWELGATLDPAARTHPNLRPYNELPEDQRRKDVLFNAIATTLGCGVERWAVKTLTDPAADQVNLTPVPASIAQLRAVPAPPTDPPARMTIETVVYQLEGTITLAKLEADSDVHMVLADAQGDTLIIEAVCPGCASGSLVARQIADVRQAVEAQFPQAAAGTAVERGLSVPVRVTGVLFMDRIHGQSGVAPNGVELHPVLSFQVQGATP